MLECHAYYATLCLLCTSISYVSSIKLAQAYYSVNTNFVWLDNYCYSLKILDYKVHTFKQIN